MDIENLHMKAEIAISRWTGCSSETADHATRAVLAIAMRAAAEEADDYDTGDFGQQNNMRTAQIVSGELAERFRTLAAQLGGDNG